MSEASLRLGTDQRTGVPLYGRKTVSTAITFSTLLYSVFYANIFYN